MTNEEFAEVVEYEGWVQILKDFNPSRLDDIALAEALVDAQTAFRALAKAVSGWDEEYEELDFD